MSRYGIQNLASLILISLLCGCAVRKKPPVTPPAQPPAVTARNWTEVSTPFPAANITAVGSIFWVCGADEMIASSSDGGSTWKLRHQKRDGAILLHIAFVNEKVGHAGGKGGLLLSTTDGGNTWNAHNTGNDVQAFSFADAKNGIGVLGPEGDINRFAQPGSGSFARTMEGVVKLTHDGGEHWDDVPMLSSAELAPYNKVLSVAALDPTHYLMIRRQTNVEDAYVVTQDAGKSWKIVHQESETNRELAWCVFAHDGEYWAFGMELVGLEKGGGYSAPLVLHSKDGERWTHGASGPKEFGGCNAQGCYMWDGAVETLYGTHEQYWAVPQDGSLSNIWAIAGDRACTIDTTLECGPAVATDKPQPSRRNLPRSVGQPYQVANLRFADDCVECGVKVIRLDPGNNWSGRVVVTFAVGQDGAVTNLSEDGAPEGPLGALIEDQVQRWRFKVPAGATSATTQQRHVFIDVKCIDAPDVSTMDGCRMFPGKDPL